MDRAGTLEPERPAFQAQLNDLSKFFNLSQTQSPHVTYGDNNTDFTKLCVWHIEGTSYMAAPVLSVNNHQARPQTSGHFLQRARPGRTEPEPNHSFVSSSPEDSQLLL